MRASRARARFERTLERWIAGDFDHIPESKADWAFFMALVTTSGEAQVMLSWTDVNIA
jgi:hypothetical protein